MLQLYVGTGLCGWFDASGVSHWEEGGDFESRMERCVEAAAKTWRGRGLRRTPVKVRVSGALVRPFLLGPVAGLKGHDEIRSFVQSQVQDATGWDQSCEVRLEGDITKGAVLAIAMPTSVHARIEMLATRAKLRLVSLRPWWADVLDGALEAKPDLELLAVEEPDSLTLLMGREFSWETAEVLSPRPSADDAVRTVQRLASSVPVRQGVSLWLRMDPVGPGSLQASWPAVAPVTPEMRS